MYGQRVKCSQEHKDLWPFSLELSERLPAGQCKLEGLLNSLTYNEVGDQIPKYSKKLKDSFLTSLLFNRYIEYLFPTGYQSWLCRGWNYENVYSSAFNKSVNIWLVQK